MAQPRRIRHRGIDRLTGGNRIERGPILSGARDLDALALLDVEKSVVAQKNTSVSAAALVFVAVLGSLLVDTPEHDGSATLAAAHVAVQLQGLLEGKPVGRSEVLCDQEEDIDATVRPAADQIEGQGGGATACLPGLLPGNDSLLKQGENAIGDELIG